MSICFFFFQAEDGIRDIGVTGVQTCALPISRVFLFVRAMTFAIVYVLPLPVTPRSVWRPPLLTPSTSCSIASGWSPLGGKASFASVKPVELLSKVLRSEEHTSELQSRQYLVCRLLLEKK